MSPDGDFYAEDAGRYRRDLDTEIALLSTPTESARFTRTFPAYSETLELRGYLNAAMIVVFAPPTVIGGRETPGVVREIPVGPQHTESAEAFAAVFRKMVANYEAQEWKR